ncbi:MAG: hypothetical protein ABR970_07745 [Roseiarcus sp.]
MRYVVEPKFRHNENSGHRPELDGAEFANLHAAITETLRHFDDQIRAAEQELEILRVLHTVSVAASCAKQDEPQNDN